MPVRKIDAKHSSLTGAVRSGKNNTSRYFESSLEKDFISILEFDSNVRDYEEQPTVIEYKDINGKLRRYTPDFFVTYKNHTSLSASIKPAIFEIKYRKDLWKNWKILKPKYQAAVRYASDHGHSFKIMTEVEIRTAYQRNAKFLLWYLNPKVDIDTDKVSHLVDLLKKFEFSSPREMIAAASISPRFQGQYLYTLWYMVAHGIIRCDLTIELDMFTEIWLDNFYA